MATEGADQTRATLLMLILIRLSWYTTGNDFELLLSFKASIYYHSLSLSTWNTSLFYCQWKGIACDTSSHVNKIVLPGGNLSGNIPTDIFRLPYLQSIDLSSNQLSGEIPGSLSFCLWLRHLNLSNNNLVGQLPKGSLVLLPRLQTLDLSNNMFSGKIPEEIGFLCGLKFLDLGGNALQGGIPKSIANMTSLESLTLASNQLTGEIPPEMGTMKSLKWVYLGYNNFSSGIPVELGELTSLNHLDLVYNNLTGAIPASLGNLTQLHYLFLYQNKLSGSIPPSIFGLTKLISLDLSDNFLSGEIPELLSQLQNLEILHLFSNKFSGKVPNALASLPRLQVLQLWSNRFSGEIPGNLGKLSNLTVLDLSGNSLAGKFPVGLCSCGHLYKLILFSNSLEGGIPKSLSHCMSLRRVRLQNNRLSGELWPELTKLPLIYYLDVSGNKLSGTLSKRKWELPELQMLNLARNNLSGDLPESFGSSKLENLDLSENGFSGSIPVSFGDLPELMQLKLSNNMLSNNIPQQLFSCKRLVSLDLSHNQLSGPIPTAITEIPALGQLDLSANQLSGEVPPSLGKMESLVEVNLSHNHFLGRLPSTGAFLAINYSAVQGNELCGGGATANLPPCKGQKGPFWWLFMTCLFVLLLVLALGVLVVIFVGQRNRLEIKKVVTRDGYGWELKTFKYSSKILSKAITIGDILLCIRDENVIHRGRNGTSYKGNSNSMQFLVEEVNGLNSVATSVWTELAVGLGELQHPNIMRLIAMCRWEKGGYVVYEYTEGMSLSEALKGMSWERRRRVAVGIAEALSYLHSNCSSSMVAGDLSPEKIIVDGKDQPRLRLCLLAGTNCFISSPYVTPGSRETKNMRDKSDMYGFGVVLIELVTGRSPEEAELGVGESIVEWARFCYSDYHIDTWVDPTISPHALNNQNEIIETMNLALHCTASEPSARPRARDAAQTLGCLVSPSSCVLGLKFSSTI